MNTDSDIRVIKILSDEKVVINKGKIDGLTLGDELRIFEPGEEITDPKTKEKLGNLDIIKANITIDVIYERMAICISNDWEEKTVQPQGVWGFISQLPNQSQKTEHVRKKLNINNEDIDNIYKVTPIKINDPVQLEP